MERRELARRIYTTSHITGSFVLRSGLRSSEYFDKYLFESDPALLRDIADHMSGMVPPETEVLAGLELGGIPITTALSLRIGLPAAFVRKKPKEYGTKKFAEGEDVTNKRVCIIEDVVTTGGQIIISADDLKRIGAKIQAVLCVILRNPESVTNLKKEGLKLLSLFTMDELVSSIK
jgi:orotate phosphoribosyltransferase